MENHSEDPTPHSRNQIEQPQLNEIKSKSKPGSKSKKKKTSGGTLSNKL